MEKYNDSNYRENIREQSPIKSTGSILKGIIFGESKSREGVEKKAPENSFFSKRGQYRNKNEVIKTIGKEGVWSGFKGNPYQKEIGGLMENHLKDSHYDEGKIRKAVDEIKRESMWNSNPREKKAGEVLVERLEGLIKKNQ